MTLPQRFIAIKATLLPLVLVFAGFAAPAFAQDGGDNRQILFSCGTGEVDDRGFLNLSGVPEDYDTWVDLRFERTADGDGHLVYSFPPEGLDYKTAFLFSHSDGPGGYLVSIRWKDDGINYVYYSLAIPPDPNAEDDMGGGYARLATSKDGKLVERVTCIERPYMFISYMRDAMSCDLANPYGEAACQDDTYDRDEEIDVEKIGIVD
ncbi:MAG: hypothetical protein ABIY37_08435 [Devosia sp.]